MLPHIRNSTALFEVPRLCLLVLVKVKYEDEDECGALWKDTEREEEKYTVSEKDCTLSFIFFF
jgi:hypothetical protein